MDDQDQGPVRPVESAIDWPEVHEWSSAMPARPDAAPFDQAQEVHQAVQMAVRQSIAAMRPLNDIPYPSHLPASRSSGQEWPDAVQDRFQPMPSDASRPYPQQNSIPRSNAAPQPYPEHLQGAAMAGRDVPVPLPAGQSESRQYPASRQPSLAGEVQAPQPMPWERAGQNPYPQTIPITPAGEMPVPAPLSPSRSSEAEYPAMRPSEPTPSSMDLFVALLAAQGDVQHHQFPGAGIPNANTGGTYDPFNEGG